MAIVDVFLLKLLNVRICKKNNNFELNSEMRGLSALKQPINVHQNWNLLGTTTHFSTNPQVFRIFFP